MPSPVFPLKGKKTDPGVTNVRNTAWSHWRRWLSPGSQCLVPLTSFSANEHLPDGSKPAVWFALGANWLLAFLGGIIRGAAVGHRYTRRVAGSHLVMAV